MATQRQHKTTVKLRKKVNGSGTKSLYLDIHMNGKRQKPKFLNLVISKSGREPEDQTNLRIAEAAQAKLQNELVVLKLGLPEDTVVSSVNTYEYILEISKNNKGHQAQYVNSKLKDFSKKDVLPISEIDITFCTGFQKYLKEKLKEGTPFAVMFAFSSYLNRAYEDGLIKENPVRRIPKRDRLKKKKSVPQYLTLEQIEKLSNNCNGIHPQIRLAFLFSCFTGLRWSDVSRLRNDQITEIVIEKRKVTILYLQQKKTNNITNIPLNEQAEKILAERRQSGKDEPASPYFFPFLIEPDPKLNKRYSLAAAQVKRWGEKAEIGQKLHFHLARHTFATLTITYGGDLFTVSKLLGHVSFQSTQIYAHVLNAPKLAAMDKLSQASRDMKASKKGNEIKIKKQNRKPVKGKNPKK
jgi:integrase/recombinase XerD